MYKSKIKNPFGKVISSFILFTFLLGQVLTPSIVQAQTLPIPGTSIGLTAGFQPPILLGLKIHPENPFLFDFIVERGQANMSDQEFKTETEKLVKYFLAALTIPDKEVWVNLSPYEANRIIPEALSKTEMGKTMLGQDYVLKQLASSLTNPEESLGQKYWANVREKVQKEYGSVEIPMNTFNKVWIVPAKAKVIENNGIVLVDEKRLKVMMEDDYLALEKNNSETQTTTQKDSATKVSNFSSAVFRDTILSSIEKEVNEGKNFMQVRQVYNSVILAAWYKQALKEGLLGKVYTDKAKIAGVEIDDKEMKQKIYEQYLEAFKKGAYNFIKEEEDPTTGDLIPRKYFSGGIAEFGVSSSGILERETGSLAQITSQVSSSSTEIATIQLAEPADRVLVAGAIAEKVSSSSVFFATIPTPEILNDLGTLAKDERGRKIAERLPQILDATSEARQALATLVGQMKTVNTTGQEFGITMNLSDDGKFFVVDVMGGQRYGIKYGLVSGLTAHTHPLLTFGYIQEIDGQKKKIRGVRSLTRTLGPTYFHKKTGGSDIMSPGMIVAGSETTGYFAFFYNLAPEYFAEYGKIESATPEERLSYLVSKNQGSLYAIKKAGDSVELVPTDLEDLENLWDSVVGDPGRKNALFDEVNLNLNQDHPGQNLITEFGEKAHVVLSYITEGKYVLEVVKDYTRQQVAVLPGAVLYSHALDIGAREGFNYYFYTLEYEKNGKTVADQANIEQIRERLFPLGLAFDARKIESDDKVILVLKTGSFQAIDKFDFDFSFAMIDALAQMHAAGVVHGNLVSNDPMEQSRLNLRNILFNGKQVAQFDGFEKSAIYPTDEQYRFFMDEFYAVAEAMLNEMQTTDRAVRKANIDFWMEQYEKERDRYSLTVKDALAKQQPEKEVVGSFSLKGGEGSSSSSTSVNSVSSDDFTKGGIDFDPTLLNLQIKRDGKGVPLPIPQQNIENINIDGLFPVIINIQPINPQTLPIFLGKSAESQPDSTVLAGNNSG